jgi:hypothetical protein
VTLLHEDMLKTRAELRIVKDQREGMMVKLDVILAKLGGPP